MTSNRSLLAAAALLGLSLAACGGSGQGGGAQPPTHPAALVDDLDGFDTAIWQASAWANGSPFNCGFLPDHVAFSGGAMSLRLDDAGSAGKPYTGAEYRTLDTFSYGRYEVRMKAAKGSGIVSSFFVYTGTPWDEIDVEILGKDTTKVQFNYYVSGVGGHEALFDLGFDASADFHTYAFDWQADAIRWYVDGELAHTVTGGVLPSRPAQIMMNLWNGLGVDVWLGSFGYEEPLYAYYDSVHYTPPTDEAP